MDFPFYNTLWMKFWNCLGFEKNLALSCNSELKEKANFVSCHFLMNPIINATQRNLTYGKLSLWSIILELRNSIWERKQTALFFRSPVLERRVDKLSVPTISALLNSLYGSHLVCKGERFVAPTPFRFPLQCASPQPFNWNFVTKTKKYKS